MPTNNANANNAKKFVRKRKEEKAEQISAPYQQNPNEIEMRG
jgi:uncharacterized membrane protein